MCDNELGCVDISSMTLFSLVMLSGAGNLKSETGLYVTILDSSLRSE